MRSVDSRVFNFRHALLSPADLGDRGPVERIRLLDPMGLGRDSAGNTYVTDRGASGSGRVVWRLGRDGRAEIVAGNGRRGDEHNHAIRMIEPNGTIRHLAGTGEPGFSPDGTRASEASLNDPENMILAGDGAVTFTEAGSARVRRIGRDGKLMTVAGGSR